MQYIIDRYLPAYVERACEKRNVQFTSYSDDWILKMQKLTVTHWVHGYNFSCNSAAAAANASDKVATHLILSHASIPSVMHILVRSVTGMNTLLKIDDAFKESPVVIKPLNGSGGLHVNLFEDFKSALKYIDSQSQPEWAMSPFINIEKEIRLIYLDNELLLAYEKQNPFIKNGLKLYNLSYGAIAYTLAEEYIDLDIMNLSRRAIGEMGLALAAVDVVIDKNNDVSILEINSGFSLERYARQSEANNNKVIDIYDKIIENMFS